MEIIKTEMSRKADLYRKAMIELNLTTSGFSFIEEDAETLSGFQKKGFTFETDNEPMSDSLIAEIESKYLELKAEWTASEYARNRQAEYPDWGSQLEKIDDDGLTRWREEMIDPIKSKWPKNNSGPV
jgi:hypothetical protein